MCNRNIYFRCPTDCQKWFFFYFSNIKVVYTFVIYNYTPSATLYMYTSVKLKIFRKSIYRNCFVLFVCLFVCLFYFVLFGRKEEGRGWFTYPTSTETVNITEVTLLKFSWGYTCSEKANYHGKFYRVEFVLGFQQKSVIMLNGLVNS